MLKGFYKSLSLTLALGMLTVSAVNATIIHDSAAEFDSLVYTDGPSFDSNPISASRTVINNLFDNNNQTLLSLGNGGDLTAIISPTTNTITNGTIIELTNGTSHDESAIVALGVDGGGWVDIGELFGNANSGGTSATNFIQSFATITAGSPTSASVFSIEVLSGAFNSIRITDTTANITGTGSQDGFDIASFSVTSVSAPGTLALFGLALVAMGMRARRAR